MLAEFDSADFSKLPFEHFVGRCTDPDACRECLDWFESRAPWKLTITDFYEQYEFDLLHTILDGAVRRLVHPETLTSLRDRVACYFNQPLSQRMEVTAHKLVAENTIRIHNDYINSGSESHRLLLQLNRGWEPRFGGYLMLFSGPEPETVSKIVEPRHGSVQAFAISPRSYHAVSTVHSGERYTVVYSFFRDPNTE